MCNFEKLTEATMCALQGKLEEDDRITSENGYNLVGDVDGYKIMKNGKLVKSFGRVNRETAIMEFDDFIENNREETQKTMADKFTGAIDIHINIDKLGENYVDNAKQILNDLMEQLNNTTGLIGGKKDLKFEDKVVGYYNCDILS